MSREFYKLERRFPVMGKSESHQIVCKGKTITIGEGYWQLSLNLESPDEELELIVVDRDQGTLVHNDKEYTILEIQNNPQDVLSSPIGTVQVIPRGHYLVRTPNKPDNLKRVLV